MFQDTLILQEAFRRRIVTHAQGAFIPSVPRAAQGRGIPQETPYGRFSECLIAGPAGGR
jgi:hypothetical protein